MALPGETVESQWLRGCKLVMGMGSSRQVLRGRGVELQLPQEEHMQAFSCQL